MGAPLCCSVGFIHAGACNVSFSLMCSVPLYGYTTLCFPIFLLIDLWVASSFKLLKIELCEPDFQWLDALRSKTTGHF